MVDPRDFTWLHKRGVRSGRGFDVQSSRFGEFTYQEADRVMRLRGEFMYGDLEGRPWGFSFDDTWQTVGWEPPHADYDVSTADRMRIRSNIIEAVEFMDGKAKFR